MLVAGKLIFAPGSSLGGARPKASVIDQRGHLPISFIWLANSTGGRNIIGWAGATERVKNALDDLIFISKQCFRATAVSKTGMEAGGAGVAENMTFRQGGSPRSVP